MRFSHALIAALTALACWTGAASAQTASIAPVALSAEFQEKLTDKIGVREADVLRSMLERNLNRALQRQGLSVTANAATRIEAEIIDAEPNRPTFYELSRNTSLSFSDSVSIGGARLRATIHTPRGAREVSYRRYSSSLDDLFLPATWYDANRAMGTFARRVASAVKEEVQ